MILFSVSHLRPRGDHSSWPLADFKHIGFFASEISAHRAIRELRLDPGFCRFPDQFRVEALELDKDFFPDGFDQQDDFALIPRC